MTEIVMHFLLFYLPAKEVGKFPAIDFPIRGKN